MIDDDAPESEPEDVLQGGDNAADAKQVKRKTDRVKLEKRKIDEFWKSVFASPIGRSEMWAILTAGHCFEERFACGPNGFPHGEATWFAAGEQALAQRLYDSWQIKDHAGVYLMRCENDPRFPKPGKA